MKKFLSVFLSFSLLFVLSVMMASCAHKCEFSSDWSKDASSHWHACTKNGCEEVADKAEHTWDEGKITTVATQESDGVKTFTCTVCAQTKTESVVFTGFSEAEWNAAFADSLFENFTYSESAVTSGSGVTVNTEAVYKFTKETAWIKMTAAGQTQEMYAPNTAAANEMRNQLIDSIKDMTSYANYQYDAATKTYKANKAIDIAALNASTSDISLTFSGNKLVKVQYSVSFQQMNIDFTATATITLSDYGEVVLNP